jgi:DNA-binding MltR family transcriptional regulator
MAAKLKNKLNAQKKERGATDQAGEVKREQQRDTRQANAEKQRRYRKSMKAKGYKAHLVWEKPLPPGMVKAIANIHESSLNRVADETKRNPLHDLWLSVSVLYQDQRISREAYDDILELLKPLGDMGIF